MKTTHLSPKTKSLARLAIVALVSLSTLAQCTPIVQQEDCGNYPCSYEFVTINLSLRYADSQPVILDSFTVYSANQNRYLTINPSTIEEMLPYGHYEIVNDNMTHELYDNPSVMQFVGYLGGTVVHRQDVVVGANCCHVIYLGTEPLRQTLTGIPEAVRESKFCEFITSENIRQMIPSYNMFAKTLSEDAPYRANLQRAADWLRSHSCIVDAQIASEGGETSYNSTILFSFLENGETKTMLMAVTGRQCFFSGLYPQQ